MVVRLADDADELHRLGEDLQPLVPRVGDVHVAAVAWVDSDAEHALELAVPVTSLAVAGVLLGFALSALVSVVAVFLEPLDAVIVTVGDVQEAVLCPVDGDAGWGGKAFLLLLDVELAVVGVRGVAVGVDDADELDELEGCCTCTWAAHAPARGNHRMLATLAVCYR